MLAGIAGAESTSSGDPWLLLTLDGSRAALQLPEPLIARLIGGPCDTRAGSDLALLLEDALADWLDAAEAAGLPTLRFTSVSLTRPALPVARTLALRGQSEAGQFVQYRAALRLSAPAARRLAAQMEDRVEPRELPSGLPISARIRMKGPAIAAQHLAELRRGDGIRLPLGAGADPLSPFTLHIGAAVATLTPEAGGYRLATPLRFQPQGGPRMDQPTETTTAQPAETPTAKPNTSPDMDALPIELAFQVGETQLSLGELGTLGAGALIPVPGGPDTTVEILANGQRIGTGELVAVGDARAVRVISLE
jgi:type III secretion protein Q